MSSLRMRLDIRGAEAEAEDHTDRKETIMVSLLSRPAIGRSLAVPAVVALAAVCVVHLLDGPGSLSDQFYIGGLELALAVACVPVSMLLLMRPTRAIWVTALALNVLAMVAFLASRTVGLPGSTDDIGNWTQTLGMVNLLSEGALIAIALVAVRPDWRWNILNG